MGISAWAYNHRKAILLSTVALSIAGLIAIFQLPVAIFPNLAVPRIIVTTDAGDLPTNLMLSEITRPLEASISGVTGVSRIRSTTQRGSDELDVSFAWGTNMQLALQQVQAAVTDTQRGFPQGASASAELLNPSVFPIMGYSLYSDTVAPEKVRQIAMQVLRPCLIRVSGVRQVMVQGGDTPEYLVQVDPQALLRFGVSVNDVQDALAKTNTVASVGSFSHNYLSYDVLVSGLLHGEEDIGRVTVAVKNRVPITIADLATVSRATERRTVATSGDGHDAVLINIVKQPDGNTVQVAQGVHAALASLGSAVPAGIHFSLFYDQSQIVLESQSSVIEAVVIGAVLALLVMLAFLRDLRAAAVVVSVLPITLLIAFLGMRVLGQSMNIMTLGALAIALGLVIDDGIVVVESVYSDLERGLPLKEAIAHGVGRIRGAMIGSSLTTIAAFAPLIFLSGVTGQFFGPLAVVMIAMLAISLTVSMLLAPLLGRWILRDKTQPSQAASSPRHANASHGGVRSFFATCLRRRGLILIGLIPLIVAGWFVFDRLQTGFFPEFDEGGFILDYLSPSGTSLAETDSACRKVEAILKQDPEIAAWSRRTGLQLGFDITPINQGDFSVRLVSNNRRPISEIMDRLRDKIAVQVPELQVDFSQILQDNVGDIAGSPSPIEVKLFGPDFDSIRPIADRVNDIVSATPGVVDVNNGIVGGGMELSIDVDTQRAQRYGLTADDVISAARAALDGVEPTQIQEGEQAIGVRVLLVSDAKRDPGTVGAIPISSPVTGGVVPLSELAAISARPGLPQVTREDQRPMIAVTGSLSGRDLGSATKDIQARIGKAIHLPPGYQIEYGGLYSSQQESFLQLALVLIAAVLLVTTLLVIQFRSFRQTIALLTAAILSLIGVILALAVTGTALNISSFTGAIMIVGIVTENGIVLFDAFNRMRAGEQLADGRTEIGMLTDAITERIRPILMTTLGAILALAPLALGFGAGAAMQKPLAVAVIGGLIVSPLMTLLVAPSLYLAMTSLMARAFGRTP